MKSILSFFNKIPVILHLYTLFILVYGFYSIFHISRQAYPNHKYDYLVIKTDYEHTTPDFIEKHITSQIEEILQKISGIKYIQSTTTNDGSLVFLSVDSSSDEREAIIQNIKIALAELQSLPPGTARPVVYDTGSHSEAVLDIILTSTRCDKQECQEELLEFAEQLKHNIFTVHEVSQISIRSSINKELTLIINPQNKLFQQFHLTTIINELTKNSLKSAGELDKMLIESPHVEVSGTLAEFTKPQITIKKNNIQYFQNGSPAIILRVFQSEFTDTMSITSKIKRRVNQLKKSLPGHIKISYNQQLVKHIRMRTRTFLYNGIAGIALLSLLMLLLFRHYLTIPLLSFAFIFFSIAAYMQILNGTFDLITSLIFIIIVPYSCYLTIHNAIIYSTHRPYKNNEAFFKSINIHTKTTSLTFITMVIIIFPVFLLRDVPGKYFHMFILTLIGTFIIVWTTNVFVVPFYAHILYKRNPKTAPIASLVNRMNEWYKQILTFILRNNTIISILLICFIAVIPLIFMRHIPFRFFGNQNLGVINIQLIAHKGTPQGEFTDIIRKIETTIASLSEPGCDNYITQRGVLDTGNFSPYRRKSLNYATISMHLKTPDGRFPASGPIIKQFEMAFAPQKKRLKSMTISEKKTWLFTTSPIKITISGPDYTILNLLSQKCTQIMARLTNTVNISQSYPPEAPVTYFDADNYIIPGSLLYSEAIIYSHLLTSNLRLQDSYIAKEKSKIALGLAGYPNQQNPFPPDTAIHIKDKYYPLPDIITQKYSLGQNELEHTNGKRSVTITAGLDPNNITLFTSQIYKSINDNVTDLLKQYPEYTITYGHIPVWQSDYKRLVYGFIVAFIIILVLSALVYRTFKIYVLKAVVLLFICSVIAIIHFIQNSPFSFLTLITIVSIKKISANYVNSMVHTITSEKDNENIIFTSARKYALLPVFTGLAVFVLLFFFSTGIFAKDNVVILFTEQVAWGTLITGLSLPVIVPVLYASFDKRRQ